MQNINQCWKVPQARNKGLHKQASVLWHKHILRDLHGSVYGNDTSSDPDVVNDNLCFADSDRVW